MWLGNITEWLGDITKWLGNITKYDRVNSVLGISGNLWDILNPQHADELLRYIQWTLEINVWRQSTLTTNNI
jgi:hypothetical protein